MTVKAKTKRRANGDIYRALYIELDEETYEALLEEKQRLRTTYANVITRALRKHLPQQNPQATEE